jgi:hypothetical protein
MGTGALSLRVKRPGREADHSPPSSAKVKEWVELLPPLPDTPSWRGAQLKNRKHRNNFTFYLYHKEQDHMASWLCDHPSLYLSPLVTIETVDGFSSNLIWASCCRF